MCINSNILKKLLFSAVVILCISGNVLSQVKNLGLPYIFNYNVDDYKAPSKQNWIAVQDKRGVIYFANNTGVLEFDGFNWNLIQITDKAIVVRALAVDSKGRVYVGGTREFGYLAPDSLGRMTYVSLVDKIEDKKAQKFIGILNIYAVKDKVYFATDDYMFEYSNGKVISYFIEKLKQIAVVNERIFLKISGKGFFEWKNGEYHQIPNSEDYKESSLRTVLPYGNDILFVTMEDGLLIYDNNNIKSFSTPIDDFLKKNKIISAVQLPHDNYALGMLSTGLIIIDKTGNVLQHIDTKVGIQSGLVSDILLDKDYNLWITTDNGISYVMTSLPLTTFDENYALNSPVYSSLYYNDLLYIASSTGLYQRKWIGTEQHFNKTEIFHQIGEPNNVFKLDTLNGVLIAASNRGINAINGTKISHIPLETISIWKFLQVYGNDNIVIVGTGKGLKILEFKGKKQKKKKKKNIEKNLGDWILKKNIRGFNEKCRHIEIDRQNNIWFTEKTKGIIKLVPHNEFDSVSVYSYNENKGIEKPFDSYIFNLNNQIIVSTDDGIYYYDDKKDMFIEHEKLNQFFDKGTKISILISDLNGNIWYKQQRKVKQTEEDVYEMGQLIKQGDGTFLNYKTPFYKFKNDIYSITPLRNGNVIIGTAKGFIHYDPNITKDYSEVYHALIRKVEFIANDSVLFDGSFSDSAGYVAINQNISQVYNIPYELNDIRFSFSSPYFDSPDQILYKFYLEGNDDSWSDWKQKSFKEYSNLDAGEYVFRVKAKNVYEIESEEAVYRFTILPPWYQTIWARVGYFICFILLIWGIVRLSVRRLRKQKEHLEEVVEQRTAEIRMKNVELEQQKEEISAQRDEIEAQRDKLSETNEQLAIKNKTIEEKNKNITASITYAKRIQEAMLPLRDKIQQSLDEHFILFKPRDIVSGDFYWFAQKNNKIVFTAVDCTGHGVPGAFMSMIGSEILTTIVNQGITTPSEILDYKNRYVRKALKQEQTDNQDGMDMSLCTIDKQNKVVEWAGAKNPLVYIQNNELIHLKGDMQSIGGHQLAKKETRNFTNHNISYANGPTYFYIFTDGFQDQFGGQTNRKFMIKRMKEIIFENYQKPLHEQEKILNTAIEDWKKGVEQTDDILVIGFKLVP